MTAGQLAALIALGAFHGLNPAMGWLFAVARGLQERSRMAMLWSLPVIAAGHAASVAVVAVAATVTGSLVASRAVAIGGGTILVGFGLWRLLSRRHFRWVGMRISLPQLAAWSFLMSSAHGAGLMLLPVLARTPGGGADTEDGHAVDSGHHTGGGAHASHAGPGGGPASASDAAVLDAALRGVDATVVHSAAMLAAAVVAAVVVYEFVGLAMLRRAWINVDAVWAVSLVAAGAATLFLR